MIFLRRTRHIASIVTLLLVASCALASQGRQNPDVSDNANGRDASAAPPIQITVTAPEVDPKIREEEAADRRREIAIQESIARFTGRQVLVGSAQLLASLLGFWVAWKAATAAQQSASATREQVQLMAVTALDVERPRAEFHHEGGNQIAAITAGYRLNNISGNVARRITVNTSYGIKGQTMKSLKPKAIHVMSPGKGLYQWVRVSGLNDTHRRFLKLGALVIHIYSEVTWIDPLNREYREIFKRAVQVGPGGVINSIYIHPDGTDAIDEEGENQKGQEAHS